MPEQRRVISGTVLAVGFTLLLAMGWPSRAAAQASDWLIPGESIAEGHGLDVSLGVDQPTVRGRVVEVILDVANGSANDVLIDASMTLGQRGHHVATSPPASRSDAQRAVQERTLTWSDLPLPRGSRGRLSAEVLVSWDASGPLEIMARVVDAERGEVLGESSLTREARIPGGDPGFLWNWGFLLILAAFFIAAQVAGFMLIRKKRSGQPVARTVGFAAAAMLLLLAAAIAKDVLEPLFWTETTCEVLDTRYSIHEYRRVRELTRINYTPSVTLRVPTKAGHIVSSGYRRQDNFLSVPDLSAWIPGTVVPCFHPPDNPADVVVVTEIRGLAVGWASGLAVVAALLIWLCRRRSPKAS